MPDIVLVLSYLGAASIGVYITFFGTLYFVCKHDAERIANPMFPRLKPAAKVGPNPFDVTKTHSRTP